MRALARRPPAPRDSLATVESGPGQHMSRKTNRPYGPIHRRRGKAARLPRSDAGTL